MKKSGQIAWKIVPLRHFFLLKVVPLIEVLLYGENSISGRELNSRTAHAYRIVSLNVAHSGVTRVRTHMKSPANMRFLLRHVSLSRSSKFDCTIVFKQQGNLQLMGLLPLKAEPLIEGRLYQYLRITKYCTNTQDVLQIIRSTERG
jgi:hypothetical protein